MRPKILIWLVCNIVALCFSGASEPLAVRASYWGNDTFLKSFNGSYRIQAALEPYMEEKERKLLMSVQTLMANGKREVALQKLDISGVKTAAIYFNRGNINFELGRDEEAKKNYEAAIRKFPTFLRAHRNLGLLYARLGDLKQAKRYLIESIRLGDQEGATYGWLGHCHLEDGDITAALQSYRLARLTEPTVANWQAGEAKCLQELGELHQAMVLLEHVVNESPKEAPYHLMQAELFLQMNEPEKSAAVYEWLLKKGELEAEYRVRLANLHLRNSNADRAVLVIEELLLDPEKWKTSSVLQWVENAVGILDWEKTDSILEHLGQLPQERLIGSQYSRVLAKHTASRKPEEAAELYLQLAKQHPLDIDVLFDHAYFLVKQEKNEFAKLQLERLLKLDSEHYRASLLYGQILVNQKLFSKAVPYLQMAQKQSSSESLMQYLEAVEARVAAE